MADILVTRVRIPCACELPPRFALLTDFHNRGAKEVEKTLAACDIDAVLIAGDLFEGPPRKREVRCDEALALLGSIAGRYPVFYSSGNHDAILPDAVRDAFDALGVHNVDGRWEYFRGFFIGGLPSATYRPKKKPDEAFLDRFASLSGDRILLCHHPEYYPRYLRSRAIPLTVSGHAHGGQWEFFGHGIFSPGQGLFPRYTHGVYDGRLVVSRGLKISRPIPRLRNPREIVLLLPENEQIGNGVTVF